MKTVSLSFFCGREVLWIFVLFVIVSTLVWCDILNFVPWNQIIFLNKSLLLGGINEKYFEDSFWTHQMDWPVWFALLPRYLLTLPVFLVAWVLDIDVHNVYGTNVVLNLIGASYFFLRAVTTDQESGIIKRILVVLCYVGPLTLCCFMNGRLSYVFFSYSLLLWWMVNRREQEAKSLSYHALVFLVIGLFSSVGSGVTVQTFLFFCALVFYFFQWRYTSLKFRFISFFILFLLSFFVITAIYKSFDYYDFSFVSLLSHSYLVFVNEKLRLLSFFCISLLCAVLFYRLRVKLIRNLRKDLNTLFFLFVVISLFLSQFGLSMIVSIIPFYSYLALTYILSVMRGNSQRVGCI